MLKGLYRLCFFFFLVAFSAVSCNKWEDTGGGENTVNTLSIASAEEFYNIRDDLSGIYMLTDNISLAAYGDGSGWEPIGTEESPFTGILDGNGFKIIDLYVDRDIAGLFGYIGNGARISNLTVEVSSSGVKGKLYAGGLAGAISGMVKVSNVYIEGTSAIQADNYAGGVSGYLSGAVTISGCGNTNTVSSSSFSPLDPSSLASSPLAPYSSSGGITGFVNASGQKPDTVMIMNCYNTGDVYSSVNISSGDIEGISSSGGVFGYVEVVGTGTGKVIIKDCYNTGGISSSAYLLSSSGGVSGYVDVDLSSWRSDIVTITNSYNAGSVSSSSDLVSTSGGIAGHIRGTGNKVTIKNNAAINTEINATSTLLPSSDCGRIVGYIFSDVSVTNNFALDTMQTDGDFNTTPANHGFSKTEKQMKTRSTYEIAVKVDGLGGLGWLFGNDDAHPWKMPPSGYPILYWQ
jgi:hypothetical protein